MHKKLQFLFLSVLIALSLAACNLGNDNNTPLSQQDTLIYQLNIIDKIYFEIAKNPSLMEKSEAEMKNSFSFIPKTDEGDIFIKRAKLLYSKKDGQ